ncbi:S8 family serine peptidase [Kangiella sediminilitoris]|uniref:Peptidase S8 and S53 subtilisin kexin sedolisin n=1 Tax=Kangiella sediminilitoris TaxID=1144748 RepID=A0A1B3B7I8_9GAMM|nr:S8 family serine peptidase [Kangiella sediminilitoris]AOE48759.1 Peptidase S8 and S53 subtilisin kexin sedolisin [Kangiella sediminilitoris]
MYRKIILSSLLVLASLQSHSARDIADRAVGKVGSQIPDVPSIPKEIDKVGDRMPEIPSQALEQIEDNIRALDNGVMRTLDPLAIDLAKLRILDKLGNTLLVETEVEDGWRAAEREWLVIANKDDIRLLKDLELEIIELKELNGLSMTLVRFRTPMPQDSQSLKKLLPEHLSQQLGRNHIYDASSSTANKSDSNRASIESPACVKNVTIGMIDTAIEGSHIALEDADITQKNFMPEEVVVPKAHGTAVAGLLVGNEQLNPLLPKAKLYAASVFYPRNDYTQGATLMHLLQALNWLVEKNVSVINMSLTGPDNPILAMGIRQAAKNNVLLIAAAGNQGPAASPRYPAAYDDVITATAVDKNKRIYRWANQGDYIDYAALGVAVKTARQDEQYGYESGTSIASPVVASQVVCTLESGDSKKEVVNKLKEKVMDLGEPGKDMVFGYGLLK